MATVTLKNVPDELYEKIKTSAAVNRRSVNQEVIFLIEQALAANAAGTEATLAEVRLLREKLGIYVTEEEVTQAKNEGRYRPTKEEIMETAKRLREKTAHYHLTDEELNKWKNEGRP
ncbi:MAG: Arc family DNA-binding protein [Anaerolineae bacterium]|nr:Arc family DNA-binding protein [Anaerolineae bacterium]